MNEREELKPKELEPEQIIKTEIEKRIAELEKEYKAGLQTLQDLNARRSQITESLLRLEGAIAGLRDLLTNRSGKPE